MITQLDVNNFLIKAQELPVFDVRAPKEFLQGHMSSAISLPLFSDEERAIVGTIYKQVGRQEAILKGLEYVGPKMRSFIEQVQAHTQKKEILLYCFRGGMRSSSMAWLLSMLGIHVYLLKGGYKKYRNFVLSSFAKKLNYIVLGGMTGSNKTEILKELHIQGVQTIDLENLANHMGSAFGGLLSKQPTQEQFENDLSTKILSLDEKKITLIEDESRNIGKIQLPPALYDQIRTTKVIKLNLSRELRVINLVENYKKFPIKSLEESFDKINKRLGGLATKNAILALNKQDHATAASIALDYYDKTYSFGLKKRDSYLIIDFDISSRSSIENAQLLINFLKDKKEVL